MKNTIKKYYEKYGPMVMRRCNQLLNDEHLAMDATQDVFVQLLRRKDIIKDEFPSTLLYRMATNVSLNMIRSKKRRADTYSIDSLVYDIAMTDDFSEQFYFKSLLSKIFKKEKESTRIMAIYHYVDGLTLKETASKMDMSVSGIRKRLRTFKETLMYNREEFLKN